MLALFKRFILLSIALILSSAVIAQDDTLLYNDYDSIQNIQIEYLNKQVGALRSLLKKNIQLQEEISDSLKIVNESQADQINRLSKESDLLKEKLTSAFEEIEDSQVKLQESTESFRTIYFITVPVLLLVTISILVILLGLLTRHKNSTNAKITALRKYTYQGIEEVREGYIDEIKRRVKKITSKLKGKGKGKGKSKKVKGKSKKLKVKD